MNTRRVRATSVPELTSREVRLQLVEVDGVMEWSEVTPSVGEPRQLRARSSSARRVAEDAVTELEFERLPPSQVTQFLATRDRKLTPKRGLRHYDATSRKLVETARTVDASQALVLIHGTFSNSDNFINSLNGTAGGRDFLERANRHYAGQVYVFDHPTLSVGPIFNAVDLARYFRGTKSAVDIVCHSRGGLVGRWWADTIAPDHCRKAVFVGAPLAGTGLAAPPNIRATINMLTKYGDVLSGVTGAASLAVPVLSVVECLLRVVTSITSLAAKTPVVDAAMAMVPGLFAMSRVGNNPELLRLMESDAAGHARYYVVRSNFEPADPGWKFWQYFRKLQIADLVGDAIFDGANDLVVDTNSMGQFAQRVKVPKDRLLDFGKSPTVHHLNYFDFPETLDFMSNALFSPR